MADSAMLDVHGRKFKRGTVRAVWREHPKLGFLLYVSAEDTTGRRIDIDTTRDPFIAQGVMDGINNNAYSYEGIKAHKCALCDPRGGVGLCLHPTNCIG